ncbi:glycosyltransferase [Microbulbifer sp. TRSA007]|uniref:glycosyltransferase n=1 Tax=Microbulbifer sp. TRSA007 TaxID=3243384 RepID=UPI0040394081
MPKKVSIVIPIYNNSEHLQDCLDSILNQTISDIEIICIDDKSEDDSVEILDEYVRKYPDIITAIKHDKNLSASQCRKDGVLSSSGEYIMFVDADDYIEPTACEIAYNSITENDTDILQFGTFIENCGNLPQSRIDSNQRMVRPFIEETISSNLMQECFLQKKFSINLWNKIYNGAICRKAFSEISDGYFPKANDLYAFFFILKYANSYSGIDDKLYHYRFGLGMTGQPTMSLENFKLHCQSVLVLNKIRESIGSEDSDIIEAYNSILNKIESNLINEQVERWFTNLSQDEKHSGLREMNAAWARGYDFIIAALAKNRWFNRSEISSYFKNFAELEHIPRKIETIALYYHSVRGGGAQRVVAHLCNLFAEAKINQNYKYNVVLVTDQPQTNDEFYISPRVNREVIPDVNLIPKKENYTKRAKAWVSIIDKYNVDIVLNSAWLSSANLWDTLTIKSHPKRPAYINHTHNFFAMIYRVSNKLSEILNSYYISDGVITLTEYDEIIWSNFNKNTYLILNPIQKLNDTCAKFVSDRKRILWLSRISDEKKPLEIVSIMEHVVKVHPDAICNIVGDGDEKIINDLRRAISQKGLDRNINIAGYNKDVGMYYSSSSVFLMTSVYEGFGLTLFESASLGLPTVMYDLPWLEYYKILEGWESVPQFDSKRAAEKICNLLSDEERWTQNSTLLKNSFAKYEKLNLLSKWETLFSNLHNGVTPTSKSTPFNKNLIEQISLFHTQAMYRETNKSNIAHKEKSEINAKLQQAYKEKSEINAKLQKTYEEKSEISAKLQKTYEEKSEISAKLQITYKEKAERGLKIKELEHELQKSKENSFVKRKLLSYFSRTEAAE